MAFTNLLTTEVLVPSDGALTPGAGTIYIGGPQLPPELVALGSTSAIVFWSVGAEASTLQYTFIADIPSLGLCRGEVNSDGSVNIFEELVINGNPPYVPAMIETFSNLRINSPNTEFFLNAAATVSAAITNLTSAPVIKAVNSTSIDLWIQLTDNTVKVTGSGGQVMLNCLFKAAWRVTIDRIIEMRWTLQTSALVNLVEYLTVPMSASILRPDADPLTGIGVHFTAQASQGGTLFRNVGGRLDSNGNMILFITGIPANTFLFEGTLTYTGLKP